MHEHEKLTTVKWVRTELKKKKIGIFPHIGNQSCHMLELKKQSQVNLHEYKELLFLGTRAVSCAQDGGACFLAQHPAAEDCRCRKVSLADSAPC